MSDCFGGCGPQVLSVTVKEPHLRPTFSAAALSSGTNSGGRLRARVYTTAPPYPTHASFLPLRAAPRGARQAGGADWDAPPVVGRRAAVLEPPPQRG
jgi:hypothetical protein